MVHTFSTAMTTALINTPLQRGGGRGAESGNRFNGFDAVRKTVETVSGAVAAWHTPLKRGVNENVFRKTTHHIRYPA